MPNRRDFVAGLLATGLAPRASWADAGAPVLLAAGKRNDANFVLCGLNASGDIVFEQPLPGRGHAAAAHPKRPEAVVFARRPGRFALVMDCVTGAVLARIDSPQGRHFYGHGTFSGDGRWLFTTENDYDAARGCVGVWDAGLGYRRAGEFASGGVGPHDIRTLPDGETLVVANGGIETHPETGRTKLNLPDMRSNLSYLTPDGTVLAQAEMDAVWHRNSIRHLAVARDGRVAFATQWQGEISDTPPLWGLHRMGGVRRLPNPRTDLSRDMVGYAGSIAISADGTRVAITSPKGGQMHEYDAGQGTLLQRTHVPDVCGVAALGDRFIWTTGGGQVLGTNLRTYPIQWDNHLIAITGGI
ncbi:MAG: DUF1513 domain-containing protein [Paracoccaceae bacterium]